MPSHDPITIRELASLADYEACVALQDDTWGHGFSERVPGAILRVAQKIGGVAAGAFDADGRLLGFVFGMTGIRYGAPVHWSDMLAVRPEARGLGLGVRLKHYQRDAVRTLGVRTMFWTADPLVARNAHLNINQLGALPAEYVENMYGDATGSVLHGAMPTDRFVYRWHDDDVTDNRRLAKVTAATEHIAVHAITRDASGVPTRTEVGDAMWVAVPVPDDLVAEQAAHPERAIAWRMAVRGATQHLMAHGYTVTRFVRATNEALPYYLFLKRG